MSKYIENILSTEGWREIESIMQKEIDKVSDMNISDELPAEEYKTVHIAYKTSYKALTDMLSTIKRAGAKKEIKEQISYK